jgi:hypothetical protein
MVVGVCGALLAVTMPIGASAFEQTTVPAGKLARPTPMEQALPGVELTVPSQTGNSGQTGAAITIPGLGALGALPRLDFGLELLYGSPDAKASGEAPSELPPDALTVYGSVKKTF